MFPFKAISVFDEFSINVKPFVFIFPTLNDEPFTLLITVLLCEVLLIAPVILNAPSAPCTINVSPFVVTEPDIFKSLPFTSLYIVVLPPANVFEIFILSVP